MVLSRHSSYGPLQNDCKRHRNNHWQTSPVLQPYMKKRAPLQSVKIKPTQHLNVRISVGQIWSSTTASGVFTANRSDPRTKNRIDAPQLDWLDDDRLKPALQPINRIQESYRAQWSGQYGNHADLKEDSGLQSDPLPRRSARAQNGWTGQAREAGIWGPWDAFFNRI